MKKSVLFIALALVVLIVAGCATFATNQEVPQPTIPVLGFVSGSKLPTGTEIASYTKVFGICIGYDDFVEEVKGKDYDVVEKWLFVINKVYAISK